LGRAGVEAEGSVVLVDGLVQPAPGAQGGGQAVVDLGRPGVESHGLAVVIDGLVQSALGTQGGAQVVVSRGIPGGEPEGLFQVAEGLVQPALVGQGDAEVVVDRRGARPQRQRRAVVARAATISSCSAELRTRAGVASTSPSWPKPAFTNAVA
jgi:hypothetical protein